MKYFSLLLVTLVLGFISVYAQDQDAGDDGGDGADVVDDIPAEEEPGDGLGDDIADDGDVVDDGVGDDVAEDDGGDVLVGDDPVDDGGGDVVDDADNADDAEVVECPAPPVCGDGQIVINGGVGADGCSILERCRDNIYNDAPAGCVAPIQCGDGQKPVTSDDACPDNAALWNCTYIVAEVADDGGDDGGGGDGGVNDGGGDGGDGAGNDGAGDDGGGDGGDGGVAGVADKIPCAWRCSRDEGADDNTLWDYAPEICERAFTEGNLPQWNQPPAAGEDQREYAGVQWQGLWLGIGWTGWWDNMLDYCVERGLWFNVTRNGNAPGSLFYGEGNTVTFQVNASGADAAVEFEVEQLDIDGCNQGQFCVRARQFTELTYTLNSPFVYFENLPDGDYEVRIYSDSPEYETDPGFNAENGWDVSVNNNQLAVDNEEVEHLFYELQIPGITLSRSGKSFAGSAELLNYLEQSDFFDRLGLETQEKQNSLTYVRQHLPQMPHYYLTILDDATVDGIGEVSVTAENGSELEVIRKYFAIYPSRTEILPQSDLQFPVSLSLDSPYVKDYGEIIIKPQMQVYWR